MSKKEEITDGAFNFIKYYCESCGKQVMTNATFCSLGCKLAYFRKLRQRKKYGHIHKKEKRKKKIYGLSDILNEEQIAEMKKEVEDNLEKRE